MGHLSELVVGRNARLSERSGRNVDCSSLRRHGGTAPCWSPVRPRWRCCRSAAHRRVVGGLVADGSDVPVDLVERSLAAAFVHASGGQEAGAPATGTNCAKASDPETSTSVNTMFVRARFPS